MTTTKHQEKFKNHSKLYTDCNQYVNCKIIKQLPSVKQWKWMSYKFTQWHREVSQIRYWEKETNCRRIYTIKFHLWKVQKQSKLNVLSRIYLHKKKNFLKSKKLWAYYFGYWLPLKKMEGNLMSKDIQDIQLILFYYWSWILIEKYSLNFTRSFYMLL